MKRKIVIKKRKLLLGIFIKYTTKILNRFSSFMDLIYAKDNFFEINITKNPI